MADMKKVYNNLMIINLLPLPFHLHLETLRNLRWKVHICKIWKQMANYKQLIYLLSGTPGCDYEATRKDWLYFALKITVWIKEIVIARTPKLQMF